MLTLISMADWIIPLMGGSPIPLTSPTSLATCSRDETSHFGATTVTPRASISSMNCRLSPVAPERERQRMFLAPWSAIQDMMARPRPPKPPTMA